MIESSQAYKNNGAIIIWWDETEGGGDAAHTLEEIVILPLAKGNAYNSEFLYTHSSRTLNTTWEEKLSIQFGRQGGVTHQLGGEPKMRLVSTALVMIAMAIMLLALTLLTTTSGP